jgi:HK97 family phage major capsid protein
MQMGDETRSGVEYEIHVELVKRKEASGQTCRGIMVPHNLRMNGNLERRGTIIDTTAGAGAIPAIQSTTLIDAVRNMVVLRRLGAIVLTDMVGTFSIPKKTATTAFEWVAEGVGATGSDITIGSVAFAMKNLTGWTRLTRSFTKQTSQDAENMVRNDFAEGMAVGMDNGGVNGTGADDQPTGLLNISGTAVVAGGTNGLALNWSNTVKQETEVATANTLMGKLGYLTNAKVRGQAKTTAKDSGSGIFIWQGNEMNGYPAEVSNVMPSNKTKGSASGICSTMLFGNFADAVFALWGGLDVVVDPNSEAKAGNVILVAHQSADFNVRRAASFSKNVDILT